MSEQVDQVSAVPVQTRGNAVAALMALGLSALTLAMGDTSLGAVLSLIRTDLQSGLATSVWIVNGFSVALASLLLVGGRITDMVGPRRPFMAGTALVLVASLAAGAASGSGVLIAARAAQGIGGALLMPASLAIITDQFSARGRGTAIGIWAGVSALGLAAGPIVGAAIAESASWRWIFLVNVPLLAICLISANAGMPRTAGGRYDLRSNAMGLAYWTIAVVMAVTALTNLQRFAITSFWTLAATAIAAAAVVQFVRTERRHRSPLVDRRLLQDRSIVAANIASLMSTAVMCGIFYFVALYLQELLSYSVTQSARELLPLTIAIVAFAPLSGRLCDRIGCRIPSTAGLVTLAVGLAAMAVSLGGAGGPAFLRTGLLLAGIGIGVATPALSAAALVDTPAGIPGMQAGILNTSRTLGLAIGVALTGAIASVHLTNAANIRIADPQGFALGLAHAFETNAVIALLAAIMFVVLGRPHAGQE